MMPSPTSGSPSFAFSDAKRMWQASASSHPPPSAKPLIAAMTGFPRVSISRSAAWPSLEDASPWSGVITASSLMSAPATKAFSRAGQDHDAHVRVLAQRGKDGVDLAHGLLVQCVQHLGPADRDARDAVLDLEDQVLVGRGHGGGHTVASVLRIHRQP